MTDKKELYTALAQAQGEMGVCIPTQIHSHYKKEYADYEDLVEASRPALSNNGLSVIHKLDFFHDANGAYSLLRTILTHASGAEIESTMLITPLKEDYPSFSAAVTNCKRISYRALLGIAIRDDEEKAAQIIPKETNTSKIEKVTDQEVGKLAIEMDHDVKLIQIICKAWNIKDLTELPRNQFSAVMEKLKTLKK